MTEVDDIEAALKDPVNSWFNSNQQLAFQRLLLIARVNKAAYETLRDAVSVEMPPLGDSRRPRGSPGAEPTPPIGRPHA